MEIQKIESMRLAEEGFNNMPERARIEQAIRGLQMSIVDLIGALYWANAEDTLVVATHMTNSLTIAALGKLGVEMNADEFDWKVVDKMLVFRIWWD